MDQSLTGYPFFNNMEEPHQHSKARTRGPTHMHPENWSNCWWDPQGGSLSLQLPHLFLHIGAGVWGTFMFIWACLATFGQVGPIWPSWPQHNILLSEKSPASAASFLFVDHDSLDLGLSENIFFIAGCCCGLGLSPALNM